MKSSILALVASSALLAFAGSAIAADLVVDVPDAPMVDSSYDWEGPYIGAFVGYHSAPLIGGEIGYNFLPSEMLLVGVNASGFLDSTGDSELWLDGRIGGTFDQVALYASGGLGLYNLSTALWRVGVGAEIAVTDSVTLNAQVGVDEVIGALPTIPYANIGVRFHF